MRGRKVPSFYSSMLKNKVDQLLKNALEERQDLFLINIIIIMIILIMHQILLLYDELFTHF